MKKRDLQGSSLPQGHAHRQCQQGRNLDTGRTEAALCPLGVQEGLLFRDQNFRAVLGKAEAAAAGDSTGLVAVSRMSAPRARRPLTTTLSSHHLVNISQTYSHTPSSGPVSAPTATLPQAGALCSRRLSTAIHPHPCLLYTSDAADERK